MRNIKYFYDLHIHTVLSPCADELMTPNNILNMAMLNKLDFIAITDHNSTKQLQVIQQLEESYDFIVIPAVEVSVKEGFDVLCYFQTYENASQFGDFLEHYLTDDWQSYTEEDQVITDIYDNTFETYKKPLTKTKLDYPTVYDMVQKLQGAVVLAHINRPSCTPLSNYKLETIPFDGIEVSPYGSEEFMKEHENILKYRIFHNSDSHSLLQLHDCLYSVELPEKSIEAFFSYLKGAHHE